MTGIRVYFFPGILNGIISLPNACPYDLKLGLELKMYQLASYFNSHGLFLLNIPSNGSRLQELKACGFYLILHRITLKINGD